MQNYSLTLESLIARASLTDGAKKDLFKCYAEQGKNSQYGFSEKVFIFGNEKGIDWDAVIALPQKQVMRCIQFVGACLSGNRLHFDYTHARILCAMRLAGSFDLNTDAVIGLAAGIKSPTANYRGITSSAVNRMFSQSHKLTTVQTKVSNMTGRNGFSQVSGMTFGAPTTNHTIALNESHAMVQAFFAVIDASTMGQIDAMNEKAMGDKG